MQSRSIPYSSPTRHAAPRAPRMRLLAGVVGLSLGAAALVPNAAHAQAATAGVRGHAPPNSQVTARNVDTGSTRHTRSGKDGNYVLVGLQPGTYQIDAGPGTRRTVTLSVATTSTLNLQAAEAAPATAANATALKGVSVTATSGLPELRTPEVSTVVPQHQIETVPQVSRNFLEFADTVPGMVFQVSPNGNTSLRGGAQNSSSVNVYIDGVGQKSYVKDGGVSGQTGSQGNPFPQLAIGQYKVITSNYKAEYGQISSAAVTAQTKSGTNEFHGEVFGRYTNDAFRERTPAEKDSGHKTESEEKEYGFALGGPIVKDKAHFFVTYEAKRFDTPVTVAPAADASPGVQYLPADIAQQLGPANLPFKEDLYFAKLDFEPTDSDRFEVTGRYRKENQLGGVGGQDAPSRSYTTVNDDRRFAARWQHSGSWYFNELLATYEDAVNAPTIRTYGNGYAYTFARPDVDVLAQPRIIATGGADPRASQDKGQKGPALQDDITFNDVEWHGVHVIKMGAKYKDIKLHAMDAANVNPQFFYSVDASGVAAAPYQVQYSLPSGLGLPSEVETKARQLGLYVQDDWDVNDKLTLNLGVRWDYERNPSYTGFVTPQAIVDAFHAQDPNAPAGQTYAQTLARGGVDIDNYISTGRNRSDYKGEWQPRLGFSYDIDADEMHVIHGGAGRAYDRNLFDYLQLETTKAALPVTTLYFNSPDGRPCDTSAPNCVDWDPTYLDDGLAKLQALTAGTTRGVEVNMLNNDLKAPYSDQYSLGMANQVGAWLTDATVTRVLSYDGFAFTRGQRYPDGSFYADAGQCGGTPGTVTGPANCVLPDFGAVILGDNGIETRSTQVLLSANKPYDAQDGWGATFAYTFTHAKQNRDITQHYSLDEPTIGDYPFITSNAAAKHRFVATGSFDGPWGTVLSAKLTLATPIPYNGRACYSDATFADGSHCREVAGTPRGSKFLVGGDIWGYRDIDFQATKNFRVGDGRTLYLRMDLLNAFNWENYVDYTTDFSGGPGADNFVAYNRTGNITYVPRTFKFEVGLKF